MRLCKVGWCKGGGEMRTEQLEHFECLCELMGGFFDLSLRSLCLRMLNLKVIGFWGFFCGLTVVVLISGPKRLLFLTIWFCQSLSLSVVVERVVFSRLHQFLTALKKLTSWLNNMQMLKRKVF